MENNQALPDNPVVMIFPQYCNPYPVDLYIARKVNKVTQGKNFGVFDINGNNIFKVQSKRFSSHVILVTASGFPLMSLKPMRFSLHQRWKVYKGNSSDSKDLLFSVQKSKYLQFNTHLDVFLASNTAECTCDFKIKQDSSRKSCIFYRGNSDNSIAEMHKNKAIEDKLRGKDTFSLAVSANVNDAFVIGMLGVLDEINTPRSNTGGGWLWGGGGFGVGGGGYGGGGGCDGGGGC
ncbi:hypothetical protein MKW94_023643 [Papaver nudicaule]|uniref:Uncharacterized protein n=1 Tax=Papaver nudicaule TaxID=74823 RepID=A0AA41VH31_PAPNU|nr:hypothetical protein [Papaver nudicaule]